MSEFSETVANRLKKQHELRESQGQDLNQQQAKQERGPEIWSLLRKEIKATCEDVNRDYSSEVLVFAEKPHDELRVELRHGRDMRTIDVKFTPITGVVHWKTAGRYDDHGEYSLYVHKDGKVDFSGTRGAGSAKAIAEKVISELTKD